MKKKRKKKPKPKAWDGFRLKMPRQSRLTSLQCSAIDDSTLNLGEYESSERKRR